MIRYHIVALTLCLVLAVLAFPGCPAAPAGRAPIDPPAAADVADLAGREKAAGIAAAEAAAKGDDKEAEYQRRLAAAIKPLREAAEERQRSQQRELEAIAVREAKAAQQEAAAAQLAKDRRWAGWAIGACVAAAAAMLLLRLPPLLAVGLPGAIGAGLLWVAAWSSVPWLAWALGLGLAVVLILGLAALAVYVVREWALHSQDSYHLGHRTADERSLARQPKPVRWLVSRMLRAAPKPPAAKS